MRQPVCVITAMLLGGLVFTALAGCDRKPAKPTAPPPAAAAKPPDSHPQVAADLLAAAKDLNGVLASIRSEADAKAAEPRLQGIAERHEAILARACALPAVTPEDEQAIRQASEPGIQAEGVAVSRNLALLDSKQPVMKIVLPQVDRIGKAASGIAMKSHIQGRARKKSNDGGAVVSDPKQIQRMNDLGQAQKDVPIPPGLQSTLAGRTYAANVAPLVKSYGVEKIVAVRFAGVPTKGGNFLVELTEKAKALRLASSNPVFANNSRTSSDVYTAYAPVKDPKDLADKLAAAGLGTVTAVDATERVITITPDNAVLPADAASGGTRPASAE